MKHDDFLKDLHIGEIIREIAKQKGVSSKKIADIISRDQNNADKIFRLNDINVEDVVRISYLLEYHILDFITQKYLSHLPNPGNYVKATSRLMKFDIQKNEVVIFDPFSNCDFLKKTHIGQHIKEVAKQNKWNIREMARQLNCSPSMVIYIYKNKSIKVKRLILISNILQYNFIAAVYLSQTTIAFALDIVDGCMLSLDSMQMRF